MLRDQHLSIYTFFQNGEHEAEKLKKIKPRKAAKIDGF